jgi:hypothetical protein
MKKKWFAIGEEEVIETDKYKYVMGYYNHEKYGKGCFRIAKYLKDYKNFFIGHFVIVPEDFDEVTDKMITIMKKGVLV